MKKLTCTVCSEEVLLANEPGETVVRGETPLEHMKRTGHDPRQPTPHKCDDCGNVWPYTGDADRPTCPNCQGKRTEPVGE